jgi:hypothetical protein
VPPGKVVPIDPRHRKSHDIECLRCGAYNIPENKNCGRCGASLPLVYDDEGKVFNWKEAQGFDEVMKIKSPTGPRRGSGPKILRVLVVMIILLFALYLFRH